MTRSLQLYDFLFSKALWKGRTVVYRSQQQTEWASLFYLTGGTKESYDFVLRMCLPSLKLTTAQTNTICRALKMSNQFRALWISLSLLSFVYLFLYSYCTVIFSMWSTLLWYHQSSLEEGIPHFSQSIGGNPVGDTTPPSWEKYDSPPQ